MVSGFKQATSSLSLIFHSAMYMNIIIKLISFQAPQIIMMTFDGAVNLNNFDHYQRVFTHDRKNPNGCPIRGTFFVSHEYSNYNMILQLAHDGHEIATETIS
jgi:hypothetical protein